MNRVFFLYDATGHLNTVAMRFHIKQRNHFPFLSCTEAYNLVNLIIVCSDLFTGNIHYK